MTQRLWRISADVPHSTRALLLRMFPPRFQRIYALSITWAYAVDESYMFNPDLQDCTLYGLHTGPDTQAFLASMGGRLARPNNQDLFLTLSTRDGVPPVNAGKIDPSRVEKIDPVTFGTQLRRHPLWQQKPQLNKHAAA